LVIGVRRESHSFKQINGRKADNRMCAFSVIIGDTIPHVIAYLFPVLAEHAGLRLLVDRRVIIILCTAAVSFPLSLHRDIVKLSKSSGFGKSLNGNEA
jgi:amino acid permease